MVQKQYHLIMSSKLYGDWGKLKKFANNFDKDLIPKAHQLKQSEGNRVAKDIRDSLLSQTLSHTDIKQETKDRKHSSQILVETGELANSIEAIPQGDKVLITPQGSHHSELSASEIAVIHEYGTETIPPRPFFRPAYEENKNKVGENFEDLVDITIAKYT